MNEKDNLQKLIDALNSGKYEKGIGKMKYRRFNQNGVFHCPLGVACEVFLEENKSSGWDWDFDMYAGTYDICNIEYGKASRSVPPKEVLEYFGLNEDNASHIIKLNDVYHVSVYDNEFLPVIIYLNERKKRIYGHTGQPTKTD